MTRHAVGAGEHELAVIARAVCTGEVFYDMDRCVCQAEF